MTSRIRIAVAFVACYFCCTVISPPPLHAQDAPQPPKRILYVTHSAGFRHGSLPVSAAAMRAVAASSNGRLDVTATEDVSLLTAASLRAYDAVFFFTSGELPVSPQQKSDLLDFVRSGKGFGGAHSATDTFYSWPEYGELIGAYFNGHPWVHEATMDVEDLRHPATAHLAPSPRLVEEYYQFRLLSRDKVRVLLSLNPTSVDLTLPDVNPGTRDFPLAWVRNYGAGRVFYTALGHFDETWQDARFRQMLLGALLWITNQADGEATPRPERKPLLTADGAGNAASLLPRGRFSPGSLISLYGTNLSDGRTATELRLNRTPLPLLYESPGQVNAYVPLDLAVPAPSPASQPVLTLELLAGGGSTSIPLVYSPFTPGLFLTTGDRSTVTLWTTGLGAVERRPDGFDHTRAIPSVKIAGVDARVLFSGLAPGWLGLYQINVAVPAGTVFPARLELTIGGSTEGFSTELRF